MRTASTLLNTLPSSTTTTTTKAAMSPPVTVQRSPWQSPVPYLFGGLAAMLGLIAFALLILACSYWKLSGSQVDNRENGDDQRDLENGGDEKTGDGNNGKAKIVYEEKIVVIMAGDVNPTFLAKPMANYKASSFGHCNGKSENKEEDEKTEKTEKEKHLEQSTTTTTVMEENSQERETQVSLVIHEQIQ